MYVRPPPSNFAGSHNFASAPPPVQPQGPPQSVKQQASGTLLANVCLTLTSVSLSLGLGIASVVIGSVNLGNSCDYNIAALLIVTGSLMLATGLLRCVEGLGVMSSPSEHRPAVTAFFACVSCLLAIATLVISILQMINLCYAWDTRTQCGVGMYWYAMTLYVFIPPFFMVLLCCLACCGAVAGLSLVALTGLTSEPDQKRLLE
jgi:uncharacterized protein YjeT (DUF2065 family)